MRIVKLMPFLVLLPFIELWVLFSLASVVGFFVTLALVLFTAFMGIYLLKAQGFETLTRVGERLAAGQSPVHEVLEGCLLFFAGGLLLTPGVISDVLGFAILLPFFRVKLAQTIAQKVTVYTQKQSFSHGRKSDQYNPFERNNPKGSDHNIIDGECEEIK